MAETTDKAPAAPRPSNRKRALKAPIQGMIGNIGLVVSSLPGEKATIDGAVIIDGAEDLAIALDKWAKQSDRVYRTLEAMFEFSLGAEVVSAVAAIILPIAANHGLVPSEVMRKITAAPEHDFDLSDEPEDQPESGNGKSNPFAVVDEVNKAK